MEFNEKRPEGDVDHRRFLRLFTAHEPAITGFVRTLVPKWVYVQEIMQEVVVVLWEKFDQYESGTDFRRWTFSVAHYEVLAFFRDRIRDKLVFDDAVLRLIADESMNQSSQSDRRLEALENCMEKLSPELRETVIQAYRPDVKIDELAAQSGKTPMSLYKVLHRIRDRLRECIENKLASEGWV